MNDDEALRAIALRDDPLPDGPPAPGHKRASLCVDIRDEDEVACIEQWMLTHAGRLSCVHSTGCGCCVIGWDIEGPAAIIDTLPPQLVSAFAWPRDYSHQEPRWKTWARSAWRVCFRR